jgi:pyrimidine operon attenuation protein/uracil phosphoribosyltransferase
MADRLPDAEELLTELARQMQGAIAYDARLVGIHREARGSPSGCPRCCRATIRSGRWTFRFYRDDYDRVGLKPAVKRTSLPFDVEGARLILIDDVLYNRPVGACGIE